MKTKHQIDILPLIVIALVIAAIAPRFFSNAAHKRDRSTVVSVPEKRELPQSEPRQVLNVYDGDTIIVKSGWETEKIRLCGIDAPELSQPLGTQSRDNLQSLIAAAGNQINLMPVAKDRYGRTVAEVFTASNGGQEQFLQEEQLKTAMAYVMERYLSDCPNADAMRSAEAIANRSHVGVWNGGGNYQKPWDYRRTKR